MVAVLGEVDVVVPVAATAEAHVAAEGEVRVASTLTEVCARWRATRRGRRSRPGGGDDGPPLPDLADVRGQPIARRPWRSPPPEVTTC